MSLCLGDKHSHDLKRRGKERRRVLCSRAPTQQSADRASNTIALLFLHASKGNSGSNLSTRLSQCQSCSATLDYSAYFYSNKPVLQFPPSPTAIISATNTSSLLPEDFLYRSSAFHSYYSLQRHCRQLLFAFLVIQGAT